jgi:hypothetical protein
MTWKTFARGAAAGAAVAAATAATTAAASASAQSASRWAPSAPANVLGHGAHQMYSSYSTTRTDLRNDGFADALAVRTQTFRGGRDIVTYTAVQFRSTYAAQQALCDTAGRWPGDRRTEASGWEHGTRWTYSRRGVYYVQVTATGPQAAQDARALTHYAERTFERLSAGE